LDSSSSDLRRPALSPRFVGLLCIVLSASGFGAMPIFARFAYADGVDLPTLLFLRFVLAGLLMTGVMFLRRLSWPRGRNLWVLVAMGGLGYAGQAFCYFAALRYATASLTALLLYLYPALVMLISVALGRRRLTPVRLWAILATLLGSGLAVGGSLGGSLAGIVLGVSAALVYSIYILVGERVTESEGAIPSGTVVMLAGAAVYALAVLATGGPTWPASLAGWVAVGNIALFSTVLAVIGFLAAMQRLGAADASTFSTLEPVITVLLAAMFLGEDIGSWQALGGVIVLTAVTVLARSGTSTTASATVAG
jgi:drug/metabolite transporter (DMT)-like permease